MRPQSFSVFSSHLSRKWSSRSYRVHITVSIFNLYKLEVGILSIISPHGDSFFYPFLLCSANLYNPHFIDVSVLSLIAHYLPNVIPHLNPFSYVDRLVLTLENMLVGPCSEFSFKILNDPTHSRHIHLQTTIPKRAVVFATCMIKRMPSTHLWH